MNVEKLLDEFVDFIYKKVSDNTYKPVESKTVSFGSDYVFEFEKGFLKTEPNRITPVLYKHFSESHFVNAINDFKDTLKLDEEIVFITENNSLFRDFAQEIFSKNSKGISKERDRIINKFNCGELFFRSKTAIEGVGIEVDSFYFIFDKIKITFCRTELKDLQDYYSSRSFITKYKFPAFYVEIEKPVKLKEINLHRETDMFHWILALFGVGSVSSIETKYSSDDSSVYNRSTSGRPSQNIRFVYSLDEKKLKGLKHLYPLLRKSLIEAGFVKGKLNALQVAFERYRDGLHYDSFQKQISSAVMGLEAIFTEKGAELSYRLTMRVSHLFKLLHQQDYSQLIKLAYNIRSDYAHGNVEIEKYEKKVIERYGKFEDFSWQILNILRTSIVVSLLLELDPQVGKVDTFQKSIDSSMLLINTNLIDKIKEKILPLADTLISEYLIHG
ncbi:MAG: hypothetical protein CME62_14935 [Halobacteriovoraceae bacterium]|nr:hypothetical protein [Halobacteriovoraceae bacterium]|tara:strand:+ start:6256 stop:7584 length:1329 start_codon:yes stop_codon:yes gene_type:complete